MLRGPSGGHGGSRLPVAFGPEPTPAALEAARAGNLALLAAQRQAILAMSLHRHDVAARLGVSARTLSALLARGALVGL